MKGYWLRFVPLGKQEHRWDKLKSTVGQARRGRPRNQGKMSRLMATIAKVVVVFPKLLYL